MEKPINVLYMPDGNHRYAKLKEISHEEAYYQGGKILEILSEFFLSRELANTLIFHALSAHTHNRIDGTLVAIFQVFTRLFREWENDCFFSKDRINVYVVDHTQKLPEDLKNAADDLMRQNQTGFEKQIFILLGYSLEKDMDMALSSGVNNYQELRRRLLFPDIDLVIRTTEMRPSRGPVYAMSQAQMITIEKMNPEVTNKDLIELWGKYSGLLEYRESTNPCHSRKIQQ